MTFAELERAFKSKERLAQIEQQKQASFDYILADLMGRSIARLYNSSNKMPPIEEVYTNLFDKEEIKANKAKLQRQRFIAGLQQYAQNLNKE